MKKIAAVVIVVSTVTFNINAQTSGLVLPYFFFDVESFIDIITTTKSSEYAKVPEIHFDLDSYFMDETLQWFSFLSRGIDRAMPFGGFYYAGFFNYRFPTAVNKADDYTRMDINAYLNAKVRLGKYFTIPLIMSLINANIGGGKKTDDENVIENRDSNSKQEYFLGSGLIFESNIGMIGAFSGVKIEAKPVENRWGYTELAREITYPVYIIPRLNTGDYPIVGLFLEKIFGYLGIKTTGGISAYSGALASPVVDIKGKELKFEIYHNSKSYNFEAENRNYGLRVYLLPNWSFDAGFRHYFNVQGDSYNYGNTGYGKIILQIPQPTILHNFYISMDNNYFPFPKLGYEISYVFGSVSFNFGATRNFYEYAMTLRFYL